MTDRLSIYNSALFRIGQRRIASLTVNEEARRVLDDIWDEGLVKYCLEQGLWNHALRTVKIDADPDFTATFGHPYRFNKPEDHVRVAEVCSDEFFQCPLLNYQDETQYWLASVTPIYVRYVSNGAQYGLNYANWPDSFVDFVCWRAGYLAIPRIKDSSADQEDAKRELRMAKENALSKDAMKEPTKFMPAGSWVRARHGEGSRRDRGSRSSLIG